VDRGLTWKHLGIALDEPWHLSYPFLFRWEGEVYMMPEASKQVSPLLLCTHSTSSSVSQAGLAALWLLWNMTSPAGRRAAQQAVALYAPFASNVCIWRNAGRRVCRHTDFVEADITRSLCAGRSQSLSCSGLPTQVAAGKGTEGPEHALLLSLNCLCAVSNPCLSDPQSSYRHRAWLGDFSSSADVRVRWHRRLARSRSLTRRWWSTAAGGGCLPACRASRAAARASSSSMPKAHSVCAPTMT